MGDGVRRRAFVALCVARFREYQREPEVLFWGFAFPLLLSVALAAAFRERPPEPSRVVVLAVPGAGPGQAAQDAPPGGAVALRCGARSRVAEAPPSRRWRR